MKGRAILAVGAAIEDEPPRPWWRRPTVPPASAVKSVRKKKPGPLPPSTIAKLREFVGPDFFSLTAQEQLHVLALAVVAFERHRLLHELLVTARWEIRTGHASASPGLAILKGLWR